MKQISHSVVMVEDIQPSLPRTEFSESDLDKAAQLILKMEGLINPLILQETEVESYTIIEGHFEYYAALRAGEIDPINGETINAYIIDSDDELPFYEQQIELFRQRQSAPTQAASKEPPPLAEPTPEEASKELLPLAEPTPEEASKELPPLAEPTQEVSEEPPPLAEPEPIATSSDMSHEKAAINEVGYFATLEKTVNTLVATNLEKTISQLGKANEDTLHKTVETFGSLMNKKFQEIQHQINQEVGKQVEVIIGDIKALQTSIKNGTEGGKSANNKKPKTPTQNFLEELEKLSSKAQKFLDAVNTQSPDEFEFIYLEKVKADKRILENIILKKSQSSFQPFESVVDLLSPSIPYLTEKAMIKILSRWS
jgi:hypothetical protein